jgi:hypothetical protein
MSRKDPLWFGGETGPTSSHTLRPEQHAALIAWANELEDDAIDRMKEDRALPDGVAPITPGFDAVLAIAQEIRDRLRPAAPPSTWAWSTDPDPEYWFIGEDGEGFPTRDAALAAARAADDFDWADELWVVTGARLKPSTTVPSCDTIDPGQWMEYFVADNYGGDYAEGWPEITPVAEVVFDELVEAWADRWLEPLPWRATGKPERVDQPRPHVMDAPDGPMCQCGKPSAHESGWCGTCPSTVPYDTEGCICTETVVGKSECPVHGPPPALLPPCPPVPCRPELCSLCGGVNPEADYTEADLAGAWSDARWIDVTEKLPEHDQPVLARFKPVEPLHEDQPDFSVVVAAYDARKAEDRAERDRGTSRECIAGELYPPYPLPSSDWYRYAARGDCAHYFRATHWMPLPGDKQ